LDAAGRVSDSARTCLELIAKHDMILATGHLGRHEIFPLVKTAKDMKVRKVLITHAEFPSQNLSAEEQVELARWGALIEHCFTTMHTGKAPWDVVVDSIRKVGASRCIVSTDLGQPINPGVAEGLAMFAEVLLENRFSTEEVRQMAVTNPAAWVE
jgi:hypothetical protein